MYKCCTVLLLLFLGISTAQEGNTSALLTQAEDVLYTDPQEAIRIAEYISEKSQQSSELLQAAYILSRGFYMKGDYNQALKIGLKFSDDEVKKDTLTHIQLNILVSKILKELEITSLATYYSNKARKEAKNDQENWVEGKIIQYFLTNEQSLNSEEKLKQLYKAKYKLNAAAFNDYQIGNLNLDISEIHLREFQLDSAEVYISNAFQESKKKKPGNYLEIESIINYGNFLFLKKEHTAAIDTLKSAMKLTHKINNPSQQITISEALAENYLALKNLNEFNTYNQIAEDLSNTSNFVENDAVNTAYNIFNSNENQRFSLLKTNSKRYLLALGGTLLILLLFYGATKLRYRSKINQYQKFINYLEKRKEAPTPSQQKRNETKRAPNVPREAEELLLTKLTDFENSLDFINKDISLSRLALQFETNTKYLSEIVNNYKQKNFNSYINELRINYIIKKLENDPQYLQYKISYLAEESGFSSHSLFATVFKTVTGISPTTFITLIKNKQENPSA